MTAARPAIGSPCRSSGGRAVTFFSPGSEWLAGPSKGRAAGSIPAQGATCGPDVKPETGARAHSLARYVGTTVRECGFGSTITTPRAPAMQHRCRTPCLRTTRRGDLFSEQQPNARRLVVSVAAPRGAFYARTLRVDAPRGCSTIQLRQSRRP